MEGQLLDMLSSIRFFLDAIEAKYCECAKADRESESIKKTATMLKKEIDDFVVKFGRYG